MDEVKSKIYEEYKNSTAYKGMHWGTFLMGYQGEELVLMASESGDPDDFVHVIRLTPTQVKLVEEAIRTKRPFSIAGPHLIP